MNPFRPSLRLTLAVLALPVTARAQSVGPANASAPAESDTTSRGLEHLRRGNAHFQARRFHEAASEYRIANELTGDPSVLYNLGRAYEEEGESTTARATYEALLRAGSPGVGEAQVRERMAILNAGIRHQEVSSSLPTSDAAPVQVLPRTHTPSHGMPPVRVAGFVAAGVGVVAGALSTIAWILREDAAHRYNAGFDGGMCVGADQSATLEPSACASDRSQVSTMSALGTGLLVAGGVLVLAGGAVASFAPTSASHDAAGGMCVPGGPGTVGFSCLVRF